MRPHRAPLDGLDSKWARCVAIGIYAEQEPRRARRNAYCDFRPRVSSGPRLAAFCIYLLLAANQGLAFSANIATGWALRCSEYRPTRKFNEPPNFVAAISLLPSSGNAICKETFLANNTDSRTRLRRRTGFSFECPAAAGGHSRVLWATKSGRGRRRRLRRRVRPPWHAGNCAHLGSTRCGLHPSDGYAAAGPVRPARLWRDFGESAGRRLGNVHTTARLDRRLFSVHLVRSKRKLYYHYVVR